MTDEKNKSLAKVSPGVPSDSKGNKKKKSCWGKITPDTFYAST